MEVSHIQYLTDNTNIRTAKHRLLVDDVTTLAMVDYFQAYQDNKIFFSRALNNKTFNNKVNLKNGSSYFDVRNHFLSNSGFKTSLTARMWKNALEEAYLLQERTYAGGLVRVKNALNHYVFNHGEFGKLTEAEKKSLFLLNHIISNPRKYFALLKYWQDGILTGFQAFIADHAKKVKFPKSFNLMTYANKVKSTLTRLINHTNIPNLAANYQPTIRVDQDCYTITSQYHEKTKQYRHYLSLVNFNGCKRFKVELSGYHHIKDFNKQVKHRKSLTLSFDYEIKQDKCVPVFYIHFGFDVKKTQPKRIQEKTPVIMAGDWGMTELFTFSNGDVFYPDNGRFYQKCADKQVNLQRKLSEIELKRRQNKQKIDYNAFQLVQNQENNFVFAKAKSNCAFKKLHRQLLSYQLKQVNDLANYLIRLDVDEFVYENVDVSLLKEESKQKNNRSRVFRCQVNLMTLHSFMDKVRTKVTQIKRFKATEINPAYSSQTCPAYGFVDNHSRNGDKFCCVSCGYIPQVTANCQVIPPKDGTQASQSDYVASLNLLHRYMCVDDLVGINKYTPKQKVKIKLLQLYEATKSLGVKYESVLLDESVRIKFKTLGSQTLT